MTQPQTKLPELEAFCMTCPAAEEVTSALQALGCQLTFQMRARIYPAYSATPDLPAQYHYSTAQGTEVIYLAGRDVGTEGERLPDHASRFWLFPGADSDVSQRVASCLALSWRLSWQRSGTAQAYEQVA